MSNLKIESSHYTHKVLDRILIIQRELIAENDLQNPTLEFLELKSRINTALKLLDSYDDQTHCCICKRELVSDQDLADEDECDCCKRPICFECDTNKGKRTP